MSASTDRRDLVFWYPGFNPYLADRFTALANLDIVNFECWFTRTIDPSRSWKVDLADHSFPHVFLPKIRIGARDIGVPLDAWRRARPRVILTFHAEPSLIGSFGQHAIPQGKLIYYVEKTFDSWTARTRPKEIAKHVLFKTADGFATPGLDADAYVHKYSRRHAPTFRLDHTLRTEHFAQSIDQRSTPKRDIVRSDLGLSGFTFLYVGRLWTQKGIGTLIEAFADIEKSGQDVSLLLVGDGVDADQFRAQVTGLGLSRVKFHPFVQQSELPDIYALADAFVFPTRGDPYGLVVDEAMASGLPVVASTEAGEISVRVVDGETGYLIGRDDPTSLRMAMTRLSQNPIEAAAMGVRGTQLIGERTPDHLAHQIEQMVNDLVGL